MKSKIKALTIILILVSAYFVGLSFMEYRTSSMWEKYADERFEIHLEETVKVLPKDYASMSEIELEEWHDENTIKKLQYAITDNQNRDRYILWGIRAKIHFQIALLSIFLTIFSWKFDHLKKKN